MKNFSIPLKNGVPMVTWGQYNKDNLPTDKDREGFHEFALLCGETSGIIALDIDSDEEEARIISVIPGAAKMLAKRGSKGRTIFFKYSPELLSRSWKKDGKVVLELLSDKRLTTIPPSKHREKGKPDYIWINSPDTPLEDFPREFLSVFDIFYPSPKREWVAPRVEEFEKVDLSAIEEMLGYISPDCSRDEWLQIGMALRDEFGDTAYQIWDSWSSKSAGKYEAKNIYTTWRSFNGSGVGIGTLIYLAQEGGWVKKYDSADFTHNDWGIDLSYLDKSAIDDNKVFTAHGLVGDIAKWITESATMPQPTLALGAALAFVGMLKGHKYCNNSGLRTNLFILNIAPTGSGKDFPQKCLTKLSRVMGLHKHLMARPTSGTGILTGLQKANRVGLITIDEVGRFLEVITSKNAGGHQHEIISYIMEMFGRANGEFSGKQYADEKANPTINLVNPHLCVLGSSVKERIVKSCSSDEAIDGFLNRWVLFETEEEPRRNKSVSHKIEVPQHIIDQIQKIIDDDPNGQYPVSDEEEPLVKLIRYTDEAYALYEAFEDETHNLKVKTPYPLKALYARPAEHVAKIALTLCDNEIIRARDVNLAIEMVAQSNKLSADFAGLISDNEQEKSVVRVLTTIKKLGNVSHSDLIRRTKFLNAKSRKEILNDLVASGEVVATESGKSFVYSA